MNSTNSLQMISAIALSKIDKKYPKDSWLHLFTDGSNFADEDGVGAVCNLSIFSCYASIGAHSTNYDGETEVVFITLKQLFIRSVIFESRGYLIRLPIGPLIYYKQTSFR